MDNGRCRMHGGASTGPRTPAGLAKAAAARTRHGGYSAAARDHLRSIDAQMAETRRILALSRADALPTDPQALRALLQPPAAPGPRRTARRREALHAP
jgi:hypothetical protein